MKKLFYSVVALATLVFAASCQQENLETVVSDANTVTYTVQVPGAMSTKTVGLDVTAVTELRYEVYRTTEPNDKTLGDDTNFLYRGQAELENGSATIRLELINDQNFTVLFWAQVPGNGIYNADNLKQVTISREANATANNLNYAAFSTVDFIHKGDVVAGKEVKLTRPVSQINIATSHQSLTKFDDDIVVTKSAFGVKGLSASFNVATQEAGDLDEEKFEYESKEISLIREDKLPVNGEDFVYVGMNYVGFAPKLGANVTVDYTLTTSEGDIYNEISNVPVKPNYRTNIVGNLITSFKDYTIVLDTEWKDLNMEVVVEGLVKNIKGDYEVTTAAGLAYAINNLFANGGNFYLTKELYEMSGFEVNPPTVPEGKTLNIYGEVPDVTRSVVAGVVTITGLDKPVIATNNGTASFSGIKIEGTEGAESAAFIETNNGTVDFAKCETTTQDFIAENTETGVVIESGNTVPEGSVLIQGGANLSTVTKVATADELVAALEAGKDVIFANDIKIEPAKMSNAYGKTGINVYKGQTIDGANYKLDVKGAGGTWDSGICTSGGLIKNIWVTGSFRGIFVKGASHIEPVVLNNVRIEGTTYTISIDQASQQGLEAIDCIFRGWTSYAATIGNVKFTNCTFGKGNGYNFSRPYAPTEYANCTFEAGHEMDPRAEVTFDGCNLNGVALTKENLINLVTSNWNNAGLSVAATVDALKDKLDEGEDVILANDLKVGASDAITAPYGNKTGLSHKGGVFNGNGKTITFDIPGDNYGIMTAGGTIKNVTVTGVFRGVVTMYPKETIYLENVVSGGKGVVYALNTTEGDSTQDLVATNCTFNGWSSWSLLKSATFTNCTFGQGSEYSNTTGRLLRPYVNTVFDGCDFCSKLLILLNTLGADQKVIVKNCTVNGVKITAENWASLVAPEDTCGEGQISVVLKNGTFLTAENVADYVVFE